VAGSQNTKRVPASTTRIFYNANAASHSKRLIDSRKRDIPREEGDDANAVAAPVKKTF
jgi:hypothetical protein